MPLPYVSRPFVFWDVSVKDVSVKDVLSVQYTLGVLPVLLCFILLCVQVPSSLHVNYVSPLEGEKLSTGDIPRNVSRFMLTEPRKYSSCNTENKPRNISNFFSNCF